MNQTDSLAKDTIRWEGDPLGDDAFLWLKSHPEVYAQLTKTSKNRDLKKLENSQGPFLDLLAEVQTAEEAITFPEATRFFSYRAMEIFTTLGLYSLPYCYAGANGVRVLIQSKRIKEEPEKRLTETAAFVVDVCREGAFLPEGKGFVAILQVRLMHAAARYYSGKVIDDEVPVNQEDMLGTLLSFSLITIRGLRKMGISVSEKEAQDYLVMWNFIGKKLGIQDQYLPVNLREATNRDRKIRKSQFKRSDEGVLLTRVLCEFVSSQKAQLKGIDPTDLMYFLLGKEVSEILEIEPSSEMTSGLIAQALRLNNFFKSFAKTYPMDLVKEFQRNATIKR